MSSKTELRPYYRSSSFKMALLFTLLLGAAVIFIGYLGFYFSRNYYIHSADSLIDAEISHLVLAADNKLLEKNIEALGQHHDRIYLLLSSAGQKLAGNTASSPRIKSWLSESIMVVEQPDPPRKFAAKAYNFPDGRKLAVGVDITADLSRSVVMQWMGGTVIAFMLIVILISFLISTFVVSRTNGIARTAKEIMDTGDLSRRIYLQSQWDDLGNMAFVLNALLERIEQLMIGIRQVSDNIAHDLRTPLTRIRNALENLKKDTGHPACDTVILEADRLLSTFNALLRIARIETGKQKTQFQNLDLTQLTRDVIELYEPLAEQKKIKLQTTLEKEIVYFGDRDLLFQAFANLLDNAIKFTPEQGKIKLTLSGGPVFYIEDNGPGVAEDEQKRIFDRFYRAEASRTTSGNGLGLSLVAAVIDLHGGAVRIENAAPGLKITASL